MTAAPSQPASKYAAHGAALAPSERFLERVALDYARDHLVLSEGVDEEGRERLVMSGRAADDLVAHNLSVRLERDVLVRVEHGEEIARRIETLARDRPQVSAAHSEPGGAEGRVGFAGEDIAAALAADERDLLRTSGRAPVVKLVHGLLFEALGRGASDVHVQPVPASAPTSGGGEVVVRYRVDGALVEAHRLPRRLLDPIVGRVKVMAQMDIAERRLPQDGRAAVTIGGQEIDLRVSSLPTAQGERLVIRLLDKRRTELFDLERLGMPSAIRRRFESLCARPYGMILVTGPTGSGKTTTLYSALRRLNCAELNIMTLEDPIEYELPGVSQSQINPRKGVTFGTGLRHVLRQDPDVIMVGEIRDAETARIAVQSALTGHMVFSTLHTNSAASAVTRLVDLGVEPYLINAALTATLAQRLVRTVCSACCGPGAATRRSASGISAAGCEVCLGTGFRGRIGLYELLVVDSRIRDLVSQGVAAGVLHDAAVRAGMQTLREAGLAAVAGGLTTRSEVDRVTLADEVDEPDIEGEVAPVRTAESEA